MVPHKVLKQMSSSYFTFKILHTPATIYISRVNPYRHPISVSNSKDKRIFPNVLTTMHLLIFPFLLWMAFFLPPTAWKHYYLVKLYSTLQVVVASWRAGVTHSWSHQVISYWPLGFTLPRVLHTKFVGPCDLNSTLCCWCTKPSQTHL